MDKHKYLGEAVFVTPIERKRIHVNQLMEKHVIDIEIWNDFTLVSAIFFNYISI